MLLINSEDMFIKHLHHLCENMCEHVSIKLTTGKADCDWLFLFMWPSDDKACLTIPLMSTHTNLTNILFLDHLDDI